MEKVNDAPGIGGVEKGRTEITGLGSPAAQLSICLGKKNLRRQTNFGAIVALEEIAVM